VADPDRILAGLRGGITVTTGDGWAPTATLEVGQYSNYTYFVINTGTASANVRLEISPHGTHWVLFPSPPGDVVGAGGMLYFVMPLVAKYARLGYKSTITGQSTTLEIYFDAPGPRCLHRDGCLDRGACTPIAGWTPDYTPRWPPGPGCLHPDGCVDRGACAVG